MSGYTPLSFSYIGYTLLQLNSTAIYWIFNCMVVLSTDIRPNDVSQKLCGSALKLGSTIKLIKFFLGPCYTLPQSCTESVFSVLSKPVTDKQTNLNDNPISAYRSCYSLKYLLTYMGLRAPSSGS